MTTLLIHHPIFLEHLVPAGHPERPDRLRAVERALAAPEFAALARRDAPEGTLAQILACHPQSYIDQIRSQTPAEGLFRLDPDTSLSPKSYSAGLYGLGAACAAVDAVVGGEANNAFCAIRPPGHHALPERAMGFCIFGNAAIAARHAQSRHGLKRIAIVDWDVHHGNGTQAMAWTDPSIFYGSIHQYPFYPGTGAASERGVGNIVNVPLPAGTDSGSFRAAFEARILPGVDAFAPELIIISAGFDAHRNDPLADFELGEEDFAWASDRVIALAQKHAKGRIVSLLEGGYDLTALGNSTAAHVSRLMRA